MPDIIHRIGIRSTPARIHAALASIAGLAGWWTQEVTGDAALGGRITFTFRSRAGEVLGSMVMAVQILRPGQAVAWRCVEGPEEWVGTDITFDLMPGDEQTILLFGHRHWREPVEFMAHCSMKWAVFLLSLRAYVETGTGQPSPGDVKIDDWN